MTAVQLYETLRRDHYQYTQGKSPRVLKATCEYIFEQISVIESLKRFDESTRVHDIDGMLSWHPPNYWSQKEIGKKYGVYAVTISKRYREIASLLGIDLSYSRYI